MDYNLLIKLIIMEGTMGEIRGFSGDYAPRNWAVCQGQTLPISEYSALYAVMGTSFGGDGRSTFKLPDLRGRIPWDKDSELVISIAIKLAKWPVWIK